MSFEKKVGYFRETEGERVMEKVDADGNVLGFSIMKGSSLKGKPFESPVPRNLAERPESGGRDL